jgi:hypothetical protein
VGLWTGGEGKAHPGTYGDRQHAVTIYESILTEILASDEWKLLKVRE